MGDVRVAPEDVGCTAGCMVSFAIMLLAVSVVLGTNTIAHAIQSASNHEPRVVPLGSTGGAR